MKLRSDQFISSMLARTLFALLGILSCGLLALGCNEPPAQAAIEERRSPPPERVLKFPEDRFAGTVYDRAWRPTEEFRDGGWREIGPAKGDIGILPGSEVKLVLDWGAAEDYSFLVSFAPDSIHSLAFDTDRIGAKDTQQIAHLTGLVDLQLSNLEIEENALKHLSRMDQLVRIGLGGSNLNDEELRHLTQLDSLFWVRLGGSSISDRGLWFLKDVDTLSRLEVFSTRITDYGLRRIRSYNPLISGLLTTNGRSSYRLPPGPTPTPRARPHG